MVKNGKGSLPSWKKPPTYLYLSFFAVIKLVYHQVFCFYSALLLGIKTFDDTDTLDPSLSLHPTSLSYLLSLSPCLLRVQDELWYLVFVCCLFWSVVVLHVIPAGDCSSQSHLVILGYLHICLLVIMWYVCAYIHIYIAVVCLVCWGVGSGGVGGRHTHKQAVSTSGTGS